LDFHRWWAADPRERFWLEITDRTDLGIDLNAPEIGANGREQWHYSLIHEVAEGDVVFHYHRSSGKSAISAWSRATGSPWPDEVTWAPHAGERKEPEKQPGWRLALEGFHPVDEPVTFTEIRANEDIIRVLEAELEDRYGRPLYTPFETGQRAIRPKQAYLTKLPADLVDAFPALVRAANSELVPSDALPTNGQVGEEYRRPNEEVLVAHGDPFSKDPALVERGLRSHAETQNALADYLTNAGVEPRSPRAKEPNYDLCWQVGNVLYVAEVKSLTPINEERQLRLAVGQVLRYRQAMSDPNTTVIPVIATPNEPTDPTWRVLCSALGITLTRPGAFQDSLPT
jgi:hypothetical protein